ncbi:unnamed protein product [Cyclocybe aegerita]|uniref:Phosphoglucomutase n=1 Tax=Cyclocybe aegerita TaxID=1973307 RepID=A0A8S0XZW0_CYCAE|nr:unnamed protein product [Cyclocybe aegerita]
MSHLKPLVDNWLRLDPNPHTRKEIRDLWDADNHEELDKRLSKRIEFGTAGLRGRMEGGWSRMNDLIIIQTSQGLAEYALQQLHQATSRGVVIGYDHRHHSEEWAHITAKVFLTKGFKVHLLHGLNHTPLVPFSIKRLNASCGVMITASHNPKQDNGYKVYWENAVQIIGPHDEGISTTIMNNLQPLPYSTDDLTSFEFCVDLTEVLRKEYFDSLKALNIVHNPPNTFNIKFVNTSMHGVSDVFVNRAFTTFGFPPYVPVTEQQLPDPEFPTVRFPNPEEKGALDMALKTADRLGADYVLAQDPDSDRFTAAEKSPEGWVLFKGDQLGTLFADQVLQSYKSSGKPINQLAMVASTVSSKMIEAMAETEGFKFVECLTGFKFIGNTALQLVEKGYEVPFGYEEAIGYMFGSQIRDKDGVAATVSFVNLALSLRARGQTVNQHLQDLYSRYGYFETCNSYFTCNDPKVTDTIFSHIRNYQPEKGTNRLYPTTLASLNITRVVDLTAGFDSGNPPEYKPSLPLSSGHMIQFRAGDDESHLVLTLR